MSFSQISRVFRRKAHLIYGLIVIAVISGLSVFVSQTLLTQTQDIRKDASSGNSTTVATKNPGKVDPQTGENYDLQINVYPFTLTKNTGSGAQYLTTVTFTIIGNRIKGLTALAGVIQKPEGTASRQIANGSDVGFSFSNDGQPTFTSVPVTLDSVNDTCIDLYSSTEVQENNYIATYCLSIDIVTPSSETNRRIYSPSGNPWLEFTYTGKNPAGVITMSSSFNKNTTNAGKNGANQQGNRVTYFTLSDGSSLTDFTNLTYHYIPLTSGLTTQEATEWCTVSDTTPKKYFSYGSSLTYEGGNLTPLTADTQESACHYAVKMNRFLPGWMNLQKENSTLPTHSTSPNTQTPTGKADLVIQDFKINTHELSGNGTIVATVKIKNEGTAPAGKVQISVLTGLVGEKVDLQTITGSDRRNKTIEIIEPGVSVEQEISVDDIFFNRNTTDRRYGIYAVVDIDNAISESNENNNRSLGEMITSRATQPTNNPISWKTDEAYLEADNFYIVAKNQYFTAKDIPLTSKISVPTSGPEATATTLELIWKELGTEMRYFIYFNRDKTEWWTKEMRTYNGKTPAAWILYARSEPFTSAAIGSKFSKTGETVFTSEDGSGSIHFTNLRMQAFLKPTISSGPEPTPKTTPTTTACTLSTDFNDDARTDIDDYVIFVSNLLHDGNHSKGDVNCDNHIDISDYPYISRNFSPLN